jgi:hypothetical protein
MSNRERRRRRREFRWNRQRTSDVADLLEAVRGLELSGGGGGGGLLDDAVGIAGEAGGALAEALPTAIGSAVGTAVGEAVSGSQVGITKPGWVPIEVENPGTADVEDVTLPVEQPTLDVHEPTLPVEEPTLAVEEPTLPVERPTRPVEDVGPVEVQVSVGRPSELAGRRRPGPTGGRAAPPASEPQPPELPDDAGVPGPGPFETIMDTASFGAQQGAMAGMPASPIGPVVGGVGGGILGGAGGAISYGLRFGNSVLEDTVNYGRPNQPSRSRPATEQVSVTNDVTVDYSPTNRLDIAPNRLDDLKKDIVDAIERSMQKDIDALEDEIEALRADFENLDRGLRDR